MASAEHGAILVSPATSGAPAWVLGDAVALEPLMLNLLLNSAQAMAPSGRASPVVDRDGADGRVVVTDSGSSIAARDRPAAPR